MRKLTSFQLGWVVAFFEGEGCFDKQMDRRRIRVTQADDAYECLERLFRLLGGTIYSHKDTRPNHQPMHVWELRGPKAIALMCRIKRYMSVKRRKQIEEALAPLSKQRREYLNALRRAAYKRNRPRLIRWRKKNQAKETAKHREYVAKHRAEINAYNRARYQINRQKAA